MWAEQTADSSLIGHPGQRQVWPRLLMLVAPAPSQQAASKQSHRSPQSEPTDSRPAVPAPRGPGRHAKLELQPRQPMQRVQQPGRRQRPGGPQRGRSDTLPYREPLPTQNAEQLAASRRSSGAAATTSGRRQPPQRAVQRPRQQRPMIQAAVNSNKPRDWKVNASAASIKVLATYAAGGVSRVVTTLVAPRPADPALPCAATAPVYLPA